VTSKRRLWSWPAPASNTKAGISTLFWSPHEAALAMFFGYYNFCRVHMTLKTTPAVKAGLAERPWTVQEFLSNTGVGS
jgi:hypothetical protein